MYEAKKSPNMLSASRHAERVSLMSQPQPKGQEDALASGDSTTTSLDERHSAKREQPGSFRIIAFHFSESRKHNRDQAKDSYPPNSFIMKAQKKHLLLALYVRFPLSQSFHTRTPCLWIDLTTDFQRCSTGLHC